MEALLLTAVVVFVVSLLPSVGPRRRRQAVSHPGQDLGSAAACKCSKTPGDIFSFDAGNTFVHVFFHYRTMGEDAPQQVDAPLTRTMPEIKCISRKGVALGHDLIAQRSVNLTIQKEVKLVTSVKAESLAEVAFSYLSYLANITRKRPDVRYSSALTDSSVYNCVCSIMAAQRFDQHNKKLQSLLALWNLLTLQEKNNVLTNFVSWQQCLSGGMFVDTQMTVNVQVLLGLLQKCMHSKRFSGVDCNVGVKVINANKTRRSKALETGVSISTNDINSKEPVEESACSHSDVTRETSHLCFLLTPTISSAPVNVYSENIESVESNQAANLQDTPKSLWLNSQNTPNTLNNVCTETTEQSPSMGLLSVPDMTCEKMTLTKSPTSNGTEIISSRDTAAHSEIILSGNIMTYKQQTFQDIMAAKQQRFLHVTGGLQDREKSIPYYIEQRSPPHGPVAKKDAILFLSNMFQRFQFL